jgi:hypothetical protein
MALPNASLPRSEAHEVADLLRPWAPDVEVRAAHEADRGYDLEIVHHGQSLLCEVRRLTSANVSAYAIESAIARTAIWTANSKQRRALVVVVASLTERMRVAIQEAFEATQKADLHLDTVAVLSRRGGAVIHFKPWNIEISKADFQEGASLSPYVQKGSGGGSLQFSEANAQLLKALLFSDMRERRPETDQWWRGPQGPFRSPDEWARICEVGRATAYRLQRVMRAEGLLSEGTRLKLAGADRLLNQWLEVEKSVPKAAYIPVKPLYPPKSPKAGRDAQLAIAWLHEVETSARAKGGMVALTGWQAVVAHGLNIVVGDRPVTAVVPLKSHLDHLLTDGGVRDCPPEEAWAYLTVARDRRSAFAGTVPREGKVPVVDLWQAALDVASDPSRGFDQAMAIAARLIKELR